MLKELDKEAFIEAERPEKNTPTWYFIFPILPLVLVIFFWVFFRKAKVGLVEITLFSLILAFACDRRHRAEQIIGHAPGGVCPFGINEDVKVYLDESLKSMDSVLPACGTSDTGIELTIPELEKSSCCTGWVDITKTLD